MSMALPGALFDVDGARANTGRDSPSGRSGPVVCRPVVHAGEPVLDRQAGFGFRPRAVA